MNMGLLGIIAWIEFPILGISTEMSEKPLKLTKHYILFRILVWPAEEWMKLCGWICRINTDIEDRV
jgi:hypothetical protein